MSYTTATLKDVIHSTGKVRYRYEVKEYAEKTETGRLYIDVTWNDDYGNGHKSFHITGDLKIGDCETGGCIHDDIMKFTPEHAEAIAFHFWDGHDERVPSRGNMPMYYYENTAFHVSECKRLRKEARRMREEVIKAGLIPSTISEEHKKMYSWEIEKLPSGEYKKLLKEYMKAVQTMQDARKALKNARGCAMWASGRLYELGDSAALARRLPALRARFKALLDYYKFDSEGY